MERETLPSPNASLLTLSLYNKALIPLRRSSDDCKETLLNFLLKIFYDNKTKALEVFFEGNLCGITLILVHILEVTWYCLYAYITYMLNGLVVGNAIILRG